MWKIKSPNTRGDAWAMLIFAFFCFAGPVAFAYRILSGGETHMRWLGDVSLQTPATLAIAALGMLLLFALGVFLVVAAWDMRRHDQGPVWQPEFEDPDNQRPM
jgi:hypothetical protein